MRACVHACMRACVRVRVCVCACVGVQTRVRTHVGEHARIGVWVREHVCAFIRMPANVRNMRASVYVQVHVHMRMHVHAYSCARECMLMRSVAHSRVHCALRVLGGACEQVAVCTGIWPCAPAGQRVCCSARLALSAVGLLHLGPPAVHPVIDAARAPKEHHAAVVARRQHSGSRRHRQVRAPPQDVAIYLLSMRAHCVHACVRH